MVTKKKVAVLREVRGTKVDITEKLSLTPVRIGSRWYIEHAVSDLLDPNLRRWRAFRRVYSRYRDERNNLVYPSEKACDVAILDFQRRCNVKGWI